MTIRDYGIVFICFVAKVPYKVTFILLGLYFLNNSDISSFIRVPFVFIVTIIPKSSKPRYISLKSGCSNGSPPEINTNNVPAFSFD